MNDRIIYSFGYSELKPCEVCSYYYHSTHFKQNYATDTHFKLLQDVNTGTFEYQYKINSILRNHNLLQ